MTVTRQGDTWSTTSVESTLTLGEALGRCLNAELTIGLVGPLGAGKTHLVKGIAAGNAPRRVSSVTSPTFTLIHEYDGRLTLYHVDAYRLRDTAELLALGFDEWMRADSVVVVEWADRVRSAMPDDSLWITLALTGPTDRDLTLQAAGPRSQRCLDALQTDDKMPT